MKVKLEDLSRNIGFGYSGDGNVEITTVASFDNAASGEITFAATPKNIENIGECKASVIIVPGDLEKEFPDKNLIKSSNPYYTFAKVLEFFFKPVKEIREGIDGSSTIMENVVIGEGCSIGSGVFIGKNSIVGKNSTIYPNTFIGSDVVIGENCHIYSNCNIYYRTTIGSNSILHSGCVVGSDGYGYILHDNIHYKIPQVGNVIIGENVEIGSNVTIDRGAIGSTVIGNGSKIDNLVHIAHNVKIGEATLIVAQVGVAGSSEIGDHVTLAGQVGVVGHVHIGSGTTVAARSVVTGDIPENSFVMGFPAKPHKEEKKIKAALRKLPELLKTIKNVQKSINNLEE